MITEYEKWHYLYLKKFSNLFKGKTSKIMNTFIVETVYIHIEQKLKEHENICKYEYSYVEMPEKFKL